MELTWGGKPSEILFDLEALPVSDEASTVATGVNVMGSSHFSLIIALKLIQRLAKARRRRALTIVELLSVTARLRLRARAHPPCRPFPSLTRGNGERLWLVQGDHGSQSNDFEK